MSKEGPFLIRMQGSLFLLSSNFNSSVLQTMMFHSPPNTCMTKFISVSNFQLAISNQIEVLILHINFQPNSLMLQSIVRLSDIWITKSTLGKATVVTLIHLFR